MRDFIYSIVFWLLAVILPTIVLGRKMKHEDDWIIALKAYLYGVFNLATIIILVAMYGG